MPTGSGAAAVRARSQLAGVQDRDCPQRFDTGTIAGVVHSLRLGTNAHSQHCCLTLSAIFTTPLRSLSMLFASNL